jgi:hypothetical protein
VPAGVSWAFRRQKMRLAPSSWGRLPNALKKRAAGGEASDPIFCQRRGAYRQYQYGWNSLIRLAVWQTITLNKLGKRVFANAGRAVRQSALQDTRLVVFHPLPWGPTKVLIAQGERAGNSDTDRKEPPAPAFALKERSRAHPCSRHCANGSRAGRRPLSMSCLVMQFIHNALSISGLAILRRGCAAKLELEASGRRLWGW